jgi:MFS family permease
LIALGPLLWAPLSEIYGRRPIFILTMAAYTLFTIPTALAPNIAFLIVFRFVAGVFAAAPLTNSGGVVADLWIPVEFGLPLGLFCLAPICGPAFGPVTGGFFSLINNNNPEAPFRYVMWILFGSGFILTLAVIFTLPETYGPTLLVEKAKRIRRETGDNNYYAKEERRTQGVFRVTLTRPTQMLLKEPILVLVW